MKIMRVILNATLTVYKLVMPKTRWANIVYLVLGYLLSQWDTLEKVVTELINLVQIG